MNTGPGPISLTLATANVFNLAAPGRLFYDNQEPYSADEYRRKVTWLGMQIRRLNADLLAVQEVWDESALRDAVQSAGLRYTTVAVPGAENGAIGTPRVGLITRLPVRRIQSLVDFPPAFGVEVPEVGPHTRFERPVLHAEVTLGNGRLAHVLVTHMKSKRPKFLQDDNGQALEDRHDPRVQTRAALRSLVMRGAEAAALRHRVLELLAGTSDPLVLMGDLNDGPHSVTSQLIAATSTLAYDRAARDHALFFATDVQTGVALRREVGYSHVYQGWPDVLDQVWVSEEFVRGSRFQIGEVLRVEHFNDHLHEGRDRARSDHGFVRVVCRLNARDLPP